MKKVIGLFAILVSFHFGSQAQEMKWYTIDEAQALNEKEPRLFFVDFTAAWCTWCKKMDQTTFSDSKVASEMNAEYYPVKMDIDDPATFAFGGKKLTAKQLAKKVAVEGLPTMVVFSSDLKSHHKIVGYKKTGQFLSSLDDVKL